MKFICWIVLSVLVLGTVFYPEVEAKSRRRGTAAARKVASSKGKRRVASAQRNSRRKAVISGRQDRLRHNRYVHSRRSRYARKRYRAPERKFVRTASAMPTERVIEIQRALIERGFLQGEPTGTYDKATVEAMTNYQKSRNLRTTGYPTAESLRDLGLSRPLSAPAQPTVLEETSPRKESIDQGGL
ncbi:MAG: peptidoglycan-binding domain-containing protein [Acidobacteriota bacterium]|nr:peptidoglycan-binding protein [Blastocatellia bacterium]MDW8411576.1 peptidoglycan-binding domain-containing protein [Acidobacteriota bacterium]